MMATQAKDGFEIYYTEKLWALVPDIYRYQDGLGNPPGVLRAIIELLGQQAAIVRRSNDRVWEDQYIELCNEWAVPYIGALLGTRMLSDQNLRGRRVDVAKTIYYRRRAGTPKVLEELITDISGWDGVMVESFTRLARARHGLDAKPVPLAGRITGTLPGGTADLREASGSELADGPFDEYYHTPDMRYPQGLEGRYGITKLAFYLYRLGYYPIENSTPFRRGTDLLYTFDPSGRDIPLFQDRTRPANWDDWHPALEWELPAPIRCRLLGDTQYMISAAVLAKVEADPAYPQGSGALTTAQLSDLVPLYGWVFEDEASMRAVFACYPSLAPLVTGAPSIVFALLLRYSITVCGKSQLLPLSISVTTASGAVPVEDVTSANLSNVNAAFISSLTTSSFGKTLAIDPVAGRFLFPDATTNLAGLTTTYFVGFPGPLGAGTYSRNNMATGTPEYTVNDGATITQALMPINGILQIADNKTYGQPDDPTPFQALTIQAADQTRPYVQLTHHWTLTSAGSGATLVLDGLWIGGLAGSQFNVYLSGTFSSVTIRNCTLDPGGTKNINGALILPVQLIVHGTIDTLCLQNSILGPVFIQQGAGEVESLIVSDCIVQSTLTGSAALTMDGGQANICQTTVLGDLTVGYLEASGVIVTGLCTVANIQAGCFRFGAASAASILPRPYETCCFKGNTNSWFTSTQFGNPAYAQLSAVAPAAVVSGGEDGYEMGAYSNLLNPFKLADLQAKVQEFMPFGLIPLFINQT